MRHICSECGKQFEEGADFCYFCGAGIKSSYVMDDEGYIYCEAPDNGFVKCPGCGAENPKDAAVCDVCGRSLDRSRYLAPRPHKLSLKEMTAIVLALIPGIFDVFGLGHLVLGRRPRAAMYMCISAVLLYVRWFTPGISGTAAAAVAVAGAVVYFIQSMEIFRLIYFTQVVRRPSKRSGEGGERTGDDWTEKYRPRTLDDIAGNPGAAKDLRAWAEKWKDGTPSVRAAVLIGSPGIGKTSSAEALARDMGWGIVEMNASDQRTGDAIRNVALRASYYNTFGSDGSFISSADGGRKLVVLDEADSLFGSADRGAMPAINELVTTALQPVVLIVNDWYELSKKSSAVKSETLQIKFRKPTAASVEKVLKKICASEGVSIDPAAVSRIAENAAGDLRAAVRDLQSLATGNPNVTLEQASGLSGREERSDMYRLVDAVFRKRDPVLAKKVLREADTDPATVSLWLDENMPYECRDRGDLVRCCERLSRADIYLGRVSKRQHYGFWTYANDMMIDGLASAVRSREVARDRIRFPSYLSKMSRSKASRALRNSLAAKIGVLTHTSRANVLSGTLHQLRIMAANDGELRLMLVKEAGLEPEELGFLIGEKMDSRTVKETFRAAEGLPEEVPEKKRSKRPAGGPSAPPAGSAPAEEPSAPSGPAPGNGGPKEQKNLFDFRGFPWTKNTAGCSPASSTACTATMPR